MAVLRMGICSISLCRLTFPCEDPFVLPGQPRAGDSAFGRQLCHGACTCAFFLFWPPASGGRLNNHLGVPPESQDEEGQEAHPGDGKQGGGGTQRKFTIMWFHWLEQALSASIRSSNREFLRARPFPSESFVYSDVWACLAIAPNSRTQSSPDGAFIPAG